MPSNAHGRERREADADASLHLFRTPHQLVEVGLRKQELDKNENVECKQCHDIGPHQVLPTVIEFDQH